MFLNELINTFKKSLSFISNMVSIDRYNPQKQTLFRILNNEM